jgi:antitoxin HicB
MLATKVISNNIEKSQRTFRVVITQDEDGVYIADIPSLIYCSSYGDTLEEAMFNIREALDGVLAVMQEEGIAIPDDSNLLEYSISMPLPLLETA